MCFQDDDLACKHKAVNQAALKLPLLTVYFEATSASQHMPCVSSSFVPGGRVVLQFMAKWLVFVTDLQCLHICALLLIGAKLL